VDVHFSRYRAESNEEIQVFQNVVLTFQRQLPPEQSIDLLDICDFLYERSLGCVGILKDWLTRSLYAAYRAARPLHRSTLEGTALSVSQCEKILAEAREGEAHLMGSRESASRLRCLLGFPESPANPHARSTGLPKSRKNKKPGLRRPKRDRIGCTMAANV
jgi:hypothetical protein